MAKSKLRAISGPMDAKHVGGVNVTSSNSSSLDSYFTNTTLEPDELPSHTFVATGTTELPRRSDTIASVIRRPSISLKRSLSRLRTKSISHLPDLHRKHESEHSADMPVMRSDSTKASRPLKMQSSMSRLRQKVGLDRELYEPLVPKHMTPESDIVPEPIQKDYPPLRVGRPLARLTTASSIYPVAPETELARTSTISQRKPFALQPQLLVAEKQPYAFQRRPSPPIHGDSSTTQTRKQPPVRPKRADSGTAIEFNNVPMDERPLGFKEILAVQTFAERMALYKKTREYWASADHGLTEWTERVGAPRLITARV
ncbi:Nn.00g108780.m01.CDS01 [Neocucurbitaria sp. VM-36]